MNHDIWSFFRRRGVNVLQVLNLVLAAFAILILSGTSPAIASPTSSITTSEPTIAVSGSSLNPAVLKLGSQGEEVRALQRQLQQRGYFSGTVDGHYGEYTRSVVREFQKSVGLTVDGIAGPQTLRRLQPMPVAAESTPAPTLSSPLRSEMPPDIQRIMDRGKLVVALLGQDNPPFFMPDARAQLDGFDVSLAMAIAEQLGVDLEFNRLAATFDEVVDQVYRLEADLAISKLSRTLNRAKRVRFSSPYLKMRQGLLVNRLQMAQQTGGRSVTEAIRHLNGKVGVIQGSSYVGFIQQKFPNATIAEFPSWTEVVAAVTQGEVLAAYRDELEIKKIVLSKPDAALQLQTIALTDTQDSIAIAVPWDSEHLLAYVNQYLDTMAPHHDVDSLLKEYSAYWSNSAT